MKRAIIGIVSYLSCTYITNTETIKISGKLYNKITSLSEDGTTTKTMYIPADSVDVQQSNKSNGIGNGNSNSGKYLGGSSMLPITNLNTNTNSNYHAQSKRNNIGHSKIGT